MFTEGELLKIRLFGKLIFTNPFSEERLQIERELLGSQHKQRYSVWHNLNGEMSVNWNLPAIAELCRELVRRGMDIWEKEDLSQDKELAKAWDLLAIYWLFSKYSRSMNENIYLGSGGEKSTALLYNDFLRDFNKILVKLNRRVATQYAPEHIFALCHQVHRAFNYIFDFIAGGTVAAANFRSAIWESIFTYDMLRYSMQLYDKMNHITTLIAGESGSGKELVAQAIAYSQFIPFNARRGEFEFTYKSCFHPVQLSAMPQSLIESELFGHVRGAFTGAMRDRQGPFENCRACESVFLDEIGEVPLEVQVKLLRLLQTRQFQRIGDVEVKRFDGKVIAATNADLANGIRTGRFRQDLLFRICSDTIQTVPLRTLLGGKEEELRQFVTILMKRNLGGDVTSYAGKCSDWIIAHLGMDYAWPGNVRELEQCLRNLLVRGQYNPLVVDGMESSEGDIGRQMLASGMKLEDMIRKYVRAMQARGDSALKMAQISGLDRRTIKKYLD